MRSFTRMLRFGLLMSALASSGFAQNDHVLISEFVVTPTAGEFIEIFNPTSKAIDLSRYYLTDDVTSNNNDYVKIVQGAAALAVANFDFLVKFPEGAMIGPQEVQTIAFSDTAFQRIYGRSANYEINNSNGSVADMTPIVVRANAGLTNASETIVLFTWDGASDLVHDVDYVVWGNKTTAVNKSGVAIDGPDADSTASVYQNDTPVANQSVVNADNDGDSDPHDVNDSAARATLEVGETLTGGNGLTGHDETSENLSFAGGGWTEGNTPTPGTVPEALIKKPAYLMATLNGKQVLSNPQASGIGGGFFILNEEQNELQFYLSLNGLSGAIVSAHFHNASAGDTGPIVRTITNDFQNNIASGEWKSTDAEPLTPELVALLLAGRLHVDIHTALYSEGEIRGQVLLGSEKNFVANLTGSQEVPPVMTSAVGVGKFTLAANGAKLSYEIIASGLSGVIAGAHFHNAAAGVNGAVVRDITSSFVGNTATGVWADTNAQAFSPALVAELLAGKIYVNVHTATNPGGEIRGQVREGAEQIFLAVLDGTQETPAVATNAAGGGRFVLNAEQTQLSYLIKVRGLSGPITAAHFHNAALGASGPPVRDIAFTDSAASGTWSSADATQPLTPTVLAELLAGHLYVNVHTALHPSGEIRGQVTNGVAIKFAAQIEASQEVPATNANAAGFGLFTLNPSADSLRYQIGVMNLSGAITGAHLHNAASGVNGAVVRDFQNDFVGDFANGIWTNTDAQPLTPELAVEALAGKIYVNVHTAANPSGEVRGQVLPNAKIITPIGLARQLPDNTRNVSIAGVITTIDFNLGSTSSSEYYLQDATGGVRLFVNGKAALAQGQRVRVKESTIASNAGRKNIETVADSLIVLDAPGLPAPQVVTALEYINNRALLEGELLRINNANLAAAFPAANSNATITLNDGTSDLALFIDRDTDIDGSVTPPNPVNLIGVATSFNNVPQLQPSARSDFRAPLVFFAQLNGKQENPAVNTSALGGGWFVLNDAQTELSYKIKVANLSGAMSAAHFHNAPLGENVGVVRAITFTDTIATGTWSSTEANTPLTTGLVAELLAGKIYVNVHTALHPSGEIRGQVLSNATAQFAANLEGAQENPPVSTTALGTGAFTLAASGQKLAYNLGYAGLSSAFSAAHFHNAGRGKNGPVVRVLDFTGANASGVWKSTDAQALTNDLVVELLAGQIYVNIHSANFPGGEIRGQVIPGAQAIMPIALARQTANGNVVTVEGIVTRALGRFARVQDATAAITLFESTGPFRTAIDSGRVRQGDRIRLTGTLAEFNALKEMAPIASFEVLTRDNALPEAQLVTLAELARNGEAYESELIRVEGLRINAAGDIAFAANKTYAIRDASDTTGAVVLRTPASSDTKIAGVSIPTGLFALEGVLGQFSSTNPAVGYQLHPILATDISPLSSVDEHNAEMPTQFALRQNYPNPFNPTTMIRYDLPQRAHVRLIIYNLLGKKVRTLVDADETPGIKRVTWNGLNDAGERLASGVYVYRLQAGSFTATRKLVLLK